MTREEEAAELLAVAQRHQVHTRRSLGSGWSLAALLGVAFLLGALLDALEYSTRVQALATGGLVLVAGFLGWVLARRTAARFGVTPPVYPLLGAVAGGALGMALSALVNSERPPSIRPTLTVSLMLVILGLIAWRSGRTEPRWLPKLSIAFALTTAAAALISPDDYGPRRLVFAVVLLGTAAVGWIRAGRRS